jgi:two-component system sensor histidine kinase ChvG
MNLRRQLLLVSLLTLVLPWAGCQFIRETESALREGQQQMLSGTSFAIADTLSQFPDEFPDTLNDGPFGENQMYGHPLASEPLIDGYFSDWALPPTSMRTMRGKDGSNSFVAGVYRQNLYIFVNVRDRNVVYEQSTPVSERHYPDHVSLVSMSPADLRSEFVFRTEAPGDIVALHRSGFRLAEENRIAAHWQDSATGYQVEARIPLVLLGDRLGIIVSNSDSSAQPGIRSSSFNSENPGRLVTASAVLQNVAGNYVQPGLRLIITDRSGWRLAVAGEISSAANSSEAYPRFDVTQALFGLILEPGATEALAGPDPSGREQQSYVSQALASQVQTSWFRSPDTGRAIVAVARPVRSAGSQIGAIILQQNTDAILSLTNQSLRRLINFTLIATLVVAFGLLGYASWLSARIAKLSQAAEKAMHDDGVHAALPSALAGDEIGGLSRSFSNVLQQLGDYNAYLRTLASKLSHELRTPLTIVTSSLENLEHESLSDSAAAYTERAREGAHRLRKILNAMSEASRVEEFVRSVEPERFDLHAALKSAVSAYAGAWPERNFKFEADGEAAFVDGSPELIIQLLDKLADNAVDFSAIGDTIRVKLAVGSDTLVMSVTNPGPPLPQKMRAQMFDSMISVRSGGHQDHLGLGLYIARLIAEGHGGNISADNTGDGVRFDVRIPRDRSGNALGPADSV